MKDTLCTHRGLRIAAKITQADMATFIGISREFLHGLESGRYNWNDSLNKDFECGLKSLPGSTYFHHGTRRKNSRSYRAWCAMRDRCQRLEFYRSVGICERWNSYLNFREDMGEPSDPKLTLERIDGFKGYSPENCKWATRSEQNQNFRKTKKYSAHGKTLTLKGWADELSCSMAKLYSRLKCGMPYDEAFVVGTYRRRAKGLPRIPLCAD